MLEVYDILHQVWVESILKIQGLGLSFKASGAQGFEASSLGIGFRV